MKILDDDEYHRLERLSLKRGFNKEGAFIETKKAYDHFGFDWMGLHVDTDDKYDLNGRDREYYDTEFPENNIEVIKKEIDILRKTNYLDMGKNFKYILNSLEFERDNREYVKNTFNSDSQLNLSDAPDDQQASAISDLWNNIQVVARAGSGKTATLINRTLFLQHYCGISANEILILAFNRKAAKEIFDRIEQVSSNSPPYIMTFHALAHAIVHPSQEIIYNDSIEDNQGLDRVFGEVIKARLEQREFLVKMRQLMLAHFRLDWDELMEKGFDLSLGELYRFQKSLARETLRGEYVKSHGEKVIANYLLEHGIPYSYERTHYWGGKVYRPDFTLPPCTENGKGIIIEYFGLVGSPNYDTQIVEKRKFWQNHKDYELLELSPRDFSGGEEAFEETIKSLLNGFGVKFNRLSEEELWLIIKPRVIRRFSSAVSGFVGRCRKLWISPKDLEGMLLRHKSISEVENQFLELANILYNDYLETLKNDNKQDFDGLMQKAAIIVESGETTFHRGKSESGDLAKLRYIFIDEYQDFSELFHRLIEAIRKHNSNAKFFCVGDDWQAINRFAGCDLKFYEKFHTYFPQSKRLYISTNYRSASSIVSAGNALMKDNGKPAVANKKDKGLVRIANLDNFNPTLLEEEKYKKGIVTPIILRIACHALKKNKNVAILCRTKELFIPSGGYVTIDKYLENIRQLIPEEWRKRIIISTAHSFKGQQADVVIIMDAFQGKYPLIHPNFIFTRILGDSPKSLDDENKRLFYVAVTRAKEELYLITDNKRKSPYLYDIEKNTNIPDVEWNDYPPVVNYINVLVVRVVGDFYELTEEFKAEGYNFRNQNGIPTREKKFKKTNNLIDALKNSAWAKKAQSLQGYNLTVYIHDDKHVVLESYFVAAGKWTKCVIYNHGDRPF